MSQLNELPSGAEVVCFGFKTVNQIKESEHIGKDDYGIDLYNITENIVGVGMMKNKVYLQF